LAFLGTLPAKLGQFLALYGGWGLLGISFLDSSLIPLPGANDLLLLHLASQRPARAVFYALASTLGSILGCYLLYGLARGGARFLWRRKRAAAIERARHWLERNDFVAVLVAALLPPPAPFKAFLVAAGGLHVNALRFGLALLVGRGLRFGTEAFLGARYGAQAEAYLQANFAWVSLVAVVVVVVMTVIYRRLVARIVPPSQGDTARSSSSGGR
jgi:membrane protein YqaA with SNARE-associated domain